MKVLITGTGGMGAHISKVLIDNKVVVATLFNLKIITPQY